MTDETLHKELSAIASRHAATVKAVVVDFVGRSAPNVPIGNVMGASAQLAAVCATAIIEASAATRRALEDRAAADAPARDIPDPPPDLDGSGVSLS